jgi:probable HAF family extracellular repeat protein
MKRNNTIRRASATLVLASTAFTILLTSTVNPAWAAKPPKPPPPPPPPAPYTYLYLGGLGGSDGNAFAINNAGQVVGQSKTAAGVQHAFIVVPQDTNNDGKPDFWNPTGTPQGINPLMTDLGIPPGVEDGSMTYAADINDLGQVVGQSWDPNGLAETWVVAPVDADSDDQPDTWYLDDGTGANALMIPLVLPGSYIDWIAINNLGQIVTTCEGVGLLLNPVDADGDGTPDTWYQDANGDGVNDLLVNLGQAFDTGGNLVPLQACELNDAGQIVGFIAKQGDRGTPFLLTPKQIATGPIWSEDVNGDGENDLTTRLPLPQTGLVGLATVLNSYGTIAGQFRTSQGPFHAILWKADAQGVMQYTDLGVPNSETHIRSQGINDRDQVVGDALLYGRKASVRSWSGWLWDNGVIKDVRTLMDKSAELTDRYMFTAGINNASLMVGFAAGTVGYYPWIAVPIP